MTTQAGTLKRTPQVSPLLASPIIERDYTKGIENQIEEPVPEPVPQLSGATPDPPPPEPDQPQFTHADNLGPDETRGFSFETPIDDDASDITDDDAPGFDLSSTSAKSFANTIGDVGQAYLPLLAYTQAAVDLNSIKMHVANGNMSPSMNDAFSSVNEATLEALKIKDDEIKMWKKAFKEWLESENMSFASPKNALLIATAAVVSKLSISTIQASKQNKQFIRDAIMSYNPQFYEEFKAKKEEEPEEEEAPKDEKPGKKKL